MMKFIRDIINFFRPKPKVELPKGTTDLLLGKPGEILIRSREGDIEWVPAESVTQEDFKRGHTCDVSTVLDKQKEFSTLTYPMALGDLIIHQASPEFLDKRLSKSSEMAAKLPKKKKLTKKQAVEINTRLIVSIITFAPVHNMTTIELQRASKIRRDRFLLLLKKLVKNGTIVRIGSGKSGDPYCYGLPESKKDNK